MGFFSTLFSPITAIFGGDKKKPNQVDQLLSSLQPYINTNKQITDTALAGSQHDIGAARTNYDDLLKYYTTFLTGSRDEQLKNINAGEITADADNTEQILQQFGVRGGRRAAALGSATFDREALINNILQQHRAGAGDHLKALSDAYASLGMGELSTAFQANQANPEILHAIQLLREHEKDRKNELIASVIGAASRIAAAGMA